MVTSNPVALVGIALSIVAVALAGCVAPPGEKPELKVGTIMPVTGSLQVFGPPGREAADAAAREVNKAAGFGFRLRLIHEDSQTQPAAGTQAAQKLRTERVAAIVGAYASGVSKAVLEVTQPNRIVQISPASTSPEFTGIMAHRDPGDRFWFRTAPSDALQGKLAGRYAREKGWECIVLFFDNNPYGNGLKATFTEAFGREAPACVPGQRIVRSFGFEENQPSYSATLQQALGACTERTRVACPSGVFFVGYPTEFKQVVRDWWAEEDWREIPWLLSEGVQDQPTFTELYGAGIEVEGFEGTAPVGTGPGFEAFERVLGAKPSLFQANAYDAVMVLALAAQAADSTDSVRIRDALRSVANPPGEKVGPADFARAVDMLAEGREIDYEGAAGTQNFDEFGDVTSAYEIYLVGADGKLSRKCFVPEANVVATPAKIPPECIGVEAPPEGALVLELKDSGASGAERWSIEPKNATRPAGTEFTIRVSSAEGNALRHNLTLIRGTRGAKVASYEPTLSAGESAEFMVPRLEAGTYTYFCAVAGHRELGMEGTLIVE